MTSKRTWILLAAMAGWILQGTLTAAPSANFGSSPGNSIGQTEYTVAVEDNQAEPVMLLMRYDGVPTLIGTITFDNNDGAPPQDITVDPVDPVVPDDPGGGFVPDPPGDDPGGGPIDNGGGPIVDPPGNGGSDPIGDDFDDNVPDDLPGEDTQTPSADNGSPGTLPVPEPSAILLSATGLIIIGLLKSRQHKN